MAAVPIEGVDYAWDRPTVSGLVAAGKKFVVRYGGPGSDGKQIHAAELAALKAAGIPVVANAEGTASGFQGRTAGRAWAEDAERHFRGLGMPADRPIYFSADWDVQASSFDEVDAALRGAAEIIGAARVGLYGGRRIIAHAKAAGTARWFWQTYAWSGGIWVPGVHLQQYRNGVPLAGGTVDLNRAMVSDYGQWGTGTPTTGDDDVTPAEFRAILADPGVATLMRAMPWQYVGGGIPAGYSTLKVLNETLAKTTTAVAKLEALAATGDDATLARIEANHREAMQRLTDMDARAVAMQAELVQDIVDALPDGTDPVTRDELTDAVSAAFARAFGQTTAPAEGQA